MPLAALSPGPDVLVLQATDGFGATRKASVPVLIDATWPANDEYGRDNDCDGIIDEGTDAYDDDRDGFSELDRDCDDANPAVHPGAVERCDNGIDDDCNGRTDSAEACVAALDAPRLVGGIDLDRTAVEFGGAVVASVHPFVPSGETLRHDWAMQDALGAFDDAHDARVVWTAPDALPDGALHAKLRMSYLGEDHDGNQLIAFTDVDVYAPGLLAPSIKVDAGGGCATFPGGSALGLAAAALISLRRSRGQRQRDGDRGLHAQEPPAQPDRVASRA